ncbi:MAG: oligosaccharide flippase family protein [Candidatus Aminicenantales bacterium]
MSFAEKTWMTLQSRGGMLLMMAAVSLVTARTLGPAGKGMFTLAFLIPYALSQVGTWSIDSGHIFLVGRKRFSPASVFANAVFLSLGLGVLYISVFAVLFPTLKNSLFPSLSIPASFIPMLLMPILLFLRFGQGYFLGNYDIRGYNISLLLMRALDVVFVVLLTAVFRFGVMGAVAAVGLSAVAAAAETFRMMSKSARFRFRLDVPLFRESVRYGLRQHPGAVAQYFNLRLDMFYLATVVDPASLGFYSIATYAAETISYIPESMAVVLFPRISSVEKEEARRIAPVVCRNAVVLVIACCGALAVLGRILIQVFFGSRFLPAYLPILLLLPGMVFLAVVKILARYMSGIGKPELNSYSALAGLIATVIGLALLVPKYGIAGAAAASSAAYLVLAVTISVFYFRESGNRFLETFVVRPSDFRMVGGFARRILRRKKSGPAS